MTIEPLLKINSAAGNPSDDTVEFHVIAIGDSDKVSEALRLTMPEVPVEDRRLTLRGVIRYRDAFNNSFETYFGSTCQRKRQRERINNMFLPVGTI